MTRNRCKVLDLSLFASMNVALRLFESYFTQWIASKNFFPSSHCFQVLLNIKSLKGTEKVSILLAGFIINRFILCLGGYYGIIV